MQNAKMAIMRRIPLTVASALLWLIALASPAAAHAVAGEDASNFLTRLVSITPEMDGLHMEVLENGNRIELTNDTDQEIVILGYQDEPYLRVGPDGVAENVRSPATYLNRDRDATTAVPGTADADAEPEWSQVSDGNVARWHDHRVHWMSEGEPDRAGERHTVFEWVVPIRAGETLVEARGDLLWIPGPSPLPWLALAAVLFAVTAIASWSDAWRPAVAAALAILIVADMVHAVGVSLASVGGLGSQVGNIFSGGGIVSVIGWIIGIVGLVLLVQGRATGMVVAAFAGMLIAFNGGIADLGGLSRSQVIFAWPESLARAAITVALGVGLGLLAGCGSRIVRSGLPETEPEPATT